MSSLARGLAKLRIESQYERWSAEAWQAAGDAVSSSGTDSPQPRSPVIISQDSLISSAGRLQQFANLPILPEIETTRIVPVNHDDADGPPADGKEVQICDVDGNQKYHIEYTTSGESIDVWFKGMTRTAWLARSLTSAQSIAADF